MEERLLFAHSVLVVGLDDEYRLFVDLAQKLVVCFWIVEAQEFDATGGLLDLSGV